MSKDRLTCLPNEILDKIFEELDFMSFVRVRAVCKEFRDSFSEDERVADIISYTDEAGKMHKFETLNKLVEKITEDIHEDIDETLLVYPMTKRYSLSKEFTNYVLVINRNVVFMEDEYDTLVKKYSYSFCIRRTDLKIPEYENIYFANNLVSKTSAHERIMLVPTLLFYIGVKVMFEIEGHSSLETSNFGNPLPVWFQTMLTSPFYPGQIVDDICKGSLEV